jgi:rfaE bifunctional protein nucleotidyltransferase chain/domain
MGKIVSWHDLKKAVEKHKSRGEKVVFTNGCFDILHVGHIRYLKEAKKLGDILIIGLNSDDSVSKIKPGRPIINESHRAEVLASLNMVDYVTIFDQETPYELISFIKPDILVKGGDWEKDKIIGSDLVKETYSLEYIKDISTTEIINKIKKLL